MILVAAVAFSVSVLPGCSVFGSAGAGHTTGASGAAGPSAAGAGTTSSAAELAAKYLNGQQPPAEATPLATADGELTQLHAEPTAATAGVLSVVADARRTVLTWQLSTEITGPTLFPLPPFNKDGTLPTTWDVQLADPVAATSAHPIVRPGGQECLCSELHDGDLGPTPTRYYAIFPPVSAAATSVQVKVPHFAAMTVPVTRG